VVGDALRSALRQEYSRLEILVLDNHSTDETQKVVAEIGGSDSRVRYIRNSENIGMARNFNACIAASSGEYVQILCADDVLEAGSVDVLSSALREHPDAVLAAASRTLADVALRPQRVVRPWPGPEKVDSTRLVSACFVHGNLIGEPSAVMFRRSAAGRGFNERYSQALDLEMWFHLLKEGPAVLLTQPLCTIRQHRGQLTQANMRSGRIVRDKQLLFRDYSASIAPSLALLEKLTWDARMASSVVRSRRCGSVADVADIAEVFYPKTFLRFLLPLIGFAWQLRGTFVSQRW
jgi:hypothetical protein